MVGISAKVKKKKKLHTTKKLLSICIAVGYLQNKKRDFNHQDEKYLQRNLRYHSSP